MEKILIRPKDVCVLLSLGRSKTYELIASGVIPSVRIGRSIRVPVEALRNWLDRQQIEYSSDNLLAAIEK
jgi:excisionase family DNA binding protein